MALPEEAFVVEAVEVLDCWLNRALTDPPLWLRDALLALEPIERKSFSTQHVPIGWAHESARLRLRLAALSIDNITPNGALLEALAQLDQRLRTAAKAETSENIRIQIGRIRMALRPHLAAKVTRRERAAYMGSRRVVL